MVLFRITNALLGVMAALWWFFNRQSDMAEPIVAVIGCSIVLIEIVGEMIAASIKSKYESQASMESKVLPDVLDRIEREEGNIQQVIEGKRKQEKIIEEYPIELIERHVVELRKLDRFMPTKKQIQPCDTVSLKLTAAERKLVLEDLMCLDEDYEQIIQQTPTGDPVMMTLGDLNDFGGYIAAESNHCDDKKKQKKLDALFEKIQDMLDRYTDEASEQPEKSKRKTTSKLDVKTASVISVATQSTCVGI